MPDAEDSWFERIEKGRYALITSRFIDAMAVISVFVIERIARSCSTRITSALPSTPNEHQTSANHRNTAPYARSNVCNAGGHTDPASASADAAEGTEANVENVDASDVECAMLDVMFIAEKNRLSLTNVDIGLRA